MKKTITSTALACALLAAGSINSNAMANTKANTPAYQHNLKEIPEVMNPIKLPGLSKTPLNHMKRGTLTIGGNSHAKLGRTFKDMTAWYGESDSDAITRFAGGTLMESSYELPDGSIELYYISPERHAPEHTLKLAGFIAHYDNSKVTDANLIEHIGKPRHILRLDSNNKIYEYSVGDKTLEFELKKKSTKKSGKKVVKWYIQSVTYGNSDF